MLSNPPSSPRPPIVDPIWPHNKKYIYHDAGFRDPCDFFSFLFCEISASSYLLGLIFQWGVSGVLDSFLMYGVEGEEDEEEEEEEKAAAHHAFF